jgi:putative ABC transport system permease protein
MSYGLTTLWHERTRYLPGVLAVAFSALLMVLQWGLLLGMFSLLVTVIDRSGADVWVGYPGVPSVDLAPTIPTAWETRLASQPEVERVEVYVSGVVFWGKRSGGVEICSVIGTRLDDGALGAVRDLTPELRCRLQEFGAVVVDESEVENLGLQVGEFSEVNGSRVRLVGTVRGLKGIAGPYIFCSLTTARRLMRLPDDQATYLLVRCQNAADAGTLVEHIRAYPNMSAFTSEEFSLRSELHWLTRTKAGIALGCTAFLGMLVGAIVTSQMFYAATLASLRQYAVLEALGIPTWRMASMVLTQAFWVGLLGIALAVPAMLGMVLVAKGLGAKVLLPTWLLASTAGLTMAVALSAGFLALRSLKQVEPTALLR